MIGPDFYARSVHDVARDLVGCVLRHGETAGVIVETEAYHESEPACHAHIGLTARTHILFGPPARAYVYRSYGIHALVNAVCEEEGIGAAVLIRALEPLEGLDLMRARRGLERREDLARHSDALDDEFYAVLSQRSWLESKVSEGGTSLPRVREQLTALRAALEG